MNNLPNEWLAQIMDFVDIKHVFVIMSVSKTWQLVARQVVRHRKELALVQRKQKKRVDDDGGDSTSGAEQLSLPTKRLPVKWCGPMDTIVFDPEDEKMDQMVKSLKRMDNLKSLFLCTSSEKFDDLIVRNAASLRVLSMTETRNGVEVTLPPVPRLKFLHWCLHQPIDSKLFPALTHLIIGDRRFQSLGTGARIAVSVCWTNDSASTARMFTHLKHLVLVEMHMKSIDISMDAAIETLVSNNPGLEKLVWRADILTDRSLKALSRLQKLKHLKLSLRKDTLSVAAVGNLLMTLSPRDCMQRLVIRPLVEKPIIMQGMVLEEFVQRMNREANQYESDSDSD